MSTVSATIDLDRPPEDVWKLIMDPTRFGDWVSIHRKIGEVDDGPCARASRSSSGWRCAARRSPSTGR
jgi:uncharacterized protein YndB with AHSA1/START domain